MQQQQVLPASLKVSAFLLAGLGKSFPSLAARLFYRFYTTPPRRRFREWHLAVKEKAVTGALSLGQYPFRNDPIRLATYRWGQSNKKVLLLHGWGGSPFDFRQMITALVNAGYEVVSFDAPAHGFSQGKRTNLVQWMHVLHQFLEQAGPLHAIVGHSLGGLNAALTLVLQQVSVPRLVMISSAVSAPAFFDDTYRQFRIPQPVKLQVQELIARRLQNDLQQLDLFRHLHKIKANRILVAYDENDQLVNPEQISDFLRQYPGIEALRIRGEGHFRIMRNETVIERVTAFLAEQADTPAP